MTNIEAIDHIIDVYSKVKTLKNLNFLTGSTGNEYICNFLATLREKGLISRYQYLTITEVLRINKKLANTGSDLFSGSYSFWDVGTAIGTCRFKELMQLKIDFLNKIKPLV